jgi:uncharacterized protein (TIGR03545 family)
VSWLKKGPFFSLLGGAALLWVLVWAFFDPLLKRALIAAGQSAAGAKVEIASVRTKWLKGEMTVDGVAVADRAAPMKNAVQFAHAALRLDMGQALRGRAVITDASVAGLRFGTARRTSGALAESAPSALETTIRKSLAPAGGAAASAAGSVKSNAVAQVDAAKLASLKKLDEARARAEAIKKEWAGRAGETKKIAAEAQAVGDELKSLGRGGSSPGDILKKISKAQDAQKKIKDLIARADAQRAAAQKELAEVQDDLKQADALRKQDASSLLAQAGLPSLDSSELTRRLLGDAAASRLETAMHWMRWAREKAAANKAAKPPKPKRGEGVTVEFPAPGAMPAFLLEKAELSGTLDAAVDGGLAFKGVLTGVTSNPKLYGKPARLDLSGTASGGRSVSLSARLDQQKDPVAVGVKFRAAGLPLAGAALGDASLGGTLSAGTAAADGELDSAGDGWDGAVKVTASGLRVENASGPAAAALKAVDGFSARVGISGTEGDLKLSFTSDLGERVAAALRKTLSAGLDAQRRAVQAKIDALYADKLKGVRGSTDGLSGQVLGPLDGQRAKLDSLLKDALGKSSGGAPNLLKGLFK